MIANSVPDKYRSIVDGLGQVPTLPAIVARVLEVLNNPNSSAEMAARLIGKDLALSAKVLRLANSAFYGIPRSISSVDQAIVILGFQTVRSLVMSASVIKILGKGQGRLDRRAVWRHSVATALATRVVVRKLGRRLGLDVEAAFMAGLLHKIGVLILDGAESAEYSKVLSEASAEEALPLPTIERLHLEIDHPAVGGMLADRWGLPEELRDPIAHHLNPIASKSQKELAAVVQLASHLAEISGLRAFEGISQWPLDPAVFAILQADPEVIPELSESLTQELEKAESFFALIDAST
ncbi:MAG TPA: HDOD domain-containing protein [Fibrobacteria bacterium]|nr:HDOD domain-containing protein [Fibrobacteria bacterium]HOX51780.1 HDOD domain-containing protein [Fibrobacteria bacterium]